MNGRKANSTKWTPFPPEYSEQISTVFKEAFAAQLGESKLIVEGKIYPSEICLRVGFREPAGLRQNNFEVSVDFSPTEQNAIETIYSCIDGIASLMNSFFEGASTQNLPVEWKPFNFEGKQMYFQYSTVNSDLEAEADKLLGAFDDHLMRDGGDDEDTDNKNLH